MICHSLAVNALLRWHRTGVEVQSKLPFLSAYMGRVDIASTYQDRAKVHVAGLRTKRLHPHSLRHSTAVALLKAGVDLSTISQWFGHASPTTTNKYATIDLEMKREALAKVEPIRGQRGGGWRNRSILDWLEGL